MRFLRRSLVGLFLLSVTAAIVAVAVQTIYGALQTRWTEVVPDRPARERIFAVNVVVAEPVDVAPVITSFGEIRSRRSLELRAAAAGEIIWISETFEEGASVRQGEALLRIDAKDATGRRDTARADLDEAEADLRDARRTLGLARDEVTSARDQVAIRERALSRQRDLLNRGVGTEAAVETAELAAQSARAAVLSRRQAEAQAEARVDQALTALDRRTIALAEAERRLAETVVNAPFSGTLGETAATLGGLMSPGEKLADLIDPEALEVVFRLSASQYARLLEGGGAATGAPVTVSLDVAGLDIAAEGRIDRESPAVGEGETGRRVFARLTGGAGFRPGDFVTVRITEPVLTGVVLLPATALDANQTILAVDADDRLESLPAPVLRRQGDDVIVASGAIAEQEIVAERTPFLGSGIKVRAIRPGSAEEPSEDDDLVDLDPERRARLIAFVEGSNRMPRDAKDRVLAQLQQPRVPARMIERLESRMGG